MADSKLIQESSLPRVRWYKKGRRFKLPKLRLRNKIHLVPHLFTLGNAFFGFCSIIFAAHDHLVAAGYLILLGALMDALDGRVARFLGQASDFGMQLDSLCDAISFCCAPALLIYFWQLKKIGFFGLVICSIFLLAGLLRLARFNLSHVQQSHTFIGLPSTIAGCFLATMLINSQYIVFSAFLSTVLGALVLSLSVLMISKVPFPAFKKVTRNVYALGALSLLAFTIIMGFTKVLLAIFVAYFAYAFTFALITKR
ncbi:CDP-diacylglycerol--serine O-phosphatidyltransferase [Candidatus Dependentiae bacterium]|jgi:CDP-diacylglycerol--serine O-phosphatidyltransferase|nr:CDP-diacylglycerol--serine O-phosphatidyltransferase [Candidatus Dependentiae bacterium]